jgi:autoinducer 2-degrading protein
MPKVALAVEIPVNPEHRDAFEAQLKDHATKTLAGEVGCIQFDAHTTPDDPNLFFIYEVYADEDAMVTHRASPQLARYREATAHMVIKRRLKEWSVLEA